MRAGMERLLELLCGQSLGGDPSETEWREVLALAEEERVLPWVAMLLREDDAPPVAVAQRVDEIEREEQKAAFFWCAELKSVLHAFAERSIRVAPLKGPFLAERIYKSTTSGGAALRPCRDLDLLVAKEDWRRAEDALGAIGFMPVQEMDDYHRPWRRRTTNLELHYDVENPLAFDFRTADALRGSAPAEFMGQPCLLLAPADELLYLCLHAARHRYDRLGLVLDLRLTFERLAIDSRRPEVAPLNGLLALGLLMARRLEPKLRAGWSPGVPDHEWQHLESVADGLWSRLLDEPVQRGDWSMAHAFYLELEPTGWRRLRRRLRHARILSTRTIDRDRVFAARFGLTHDWQIRMLRPVRLLLERVRRG